MGGVADVLRVDGVLVDRGEVVGPVEAADQHGRLGVIAADDGYHVLHQRFPLRPGADA